MVTGWDEMTPQQPFPDLAKITVAVVTGEQPFNVPGFHNMFRSMPEIDHYPQHMDQFVADWGKVRTRYDVVLFFNWHQDTPPGNERGWWQRGTKEAIEQLGETGQGIVLLHHAIYAFPQWEFWSRLVGIPHAQRTYAWDDLAGTLSLGETLHVGIADVGHPIVHGLSAWDVHGETWGLRAAEPEADCHVILVTDHPKMCLKAMAWTHHFGKSRVFCLQPGHDNDSFADPNFRTVLSRGIQWASGRL